MPLLGTLTKHYACPGTICILYNNIIIPTDSKELTTIKLKQKYILSRPTGLIFIIFKLSIILGTQVRGSTEFNANLDLHKCMKRSPGCLVPDLHSVNRIQIQTFPVPLFLFSRTIISTWKTSITKGKSFHRSHNFINKLRKGQTHRLQSSELQTADSGPDGTRYDNTRSVSFAEPKRLSLLVGHTSV